MSPTASTASLRSLLPAGTAVSEWWGDPVAARLFAEEAAVVADAVERRRREFATGRACARSALARLGLPPGPLLPGADGAPVWPAGVRGSLTHCDGYAAAAVAPDRRLAGVGIDAEPDEPLPEGVLDLVATPAERRLLTGSPVPGEPARDRLLFSAKEAVYKAWAPLVGEWLDALEVDVVLDDSAPSGSGFTAHLGRSGLEVDGEPVTVVRGRWRRCRGVLLTVAVVPRVSGGGPAPAARELPPRADAP